MQAEQGCETVKEDLARQEMKNHLRSRRMKPPVKKTVIFGADERRRKERESHEQN